MLVSTPSIYSKVFTSHYVSINSDCLYTHHSFHFYLHPTMYLLIRTKANNLTLYPNNLHPTMYLLILTKPIHTFDIDSNLHPTMYLLIPVIIKASLFLNSEALFCLPFKSANRLLILYALNMPEA